jgi:hypothetical protein
MDLHEPEELLGIGDIGDAQFSVNCFHFQTVTICHGLIPLSFESLL